MNKKIFSLIVVLLFCKNLFSADWTVAVYMQTNEDLIPFALFNLAQMAQVGSNSRINIVAQIPNPSNPSLNAFRLHIIKDHVLIVQSLPINMGSDTPNQLVDFVQWTVANYPANHYLIIVWGDANGILDYIFPPATLLSFKTREFFAEINKINSALPEELKTFSIESTVKTPVRATLIDFDLQTFLNNQQMSLALNEIKTNILGNKKIDILGFDSCLMGMVEVGYQIKNYVDYFVASQNFEWGFGWNYAGFLAPMSEEDSTPDQVIQYITLSFQSFFAANGFSDYTLSGVDLRKIPYLNEDISSFVFYLNQCMGINKSTVKDAIIKARENSLDFETRFATGQKDNIDLTSFCTGLLKFLPDTLISPFLSNAKKAAYANNAKLAKQSLSNTISTIQNIVLINVAGADFPESEGLTIYFPKGPIDHSYINIDFVKDATKDHSWAWLLNSVKTSPAQA